MSAQRTLTDVLKGVGTQMAATNATATQDTDWLVTTMDVTVNHCYM